MMHALLLSAAAGLSTGLGGLIVFFLRRPSQRVMSFSLGFAGGVMITVSLSDLLPQVTALYAASMGRAKAGFCAASLCGLGMAAAALIGALVPEHTGTADGQEQRVYRTAFVTTFSVMLHNLPEGILTLFTSYADPSLGVLLTFAVALHNIPEGIAVAVPVYCASRSRVKAAVYAFLSGAAEPAGALLAFFCLRTLLTPLFLNGLIALISGVMLWVSAAELVPQSFSFGKSGTAACGISAGVLVMSVGICLV